MNHLIMSSLFMVSLLGHRYALSKYAKFKDTAVWIIVVLILNSTIFVGLILDELNITIAVYTLIGIILLLLSLDSIKKVSLRMPHILMLFVLAIFAFALSNASLVHYDNFSHWAKIIRFISETMRLPGSRDIIIEFTSYPPGSALFPALTTRLFFFSEPIMLISQFVMISISILALFSNVKDKNRLQPQLLLFLSVGVSFMASKSIGFDTLLVDYLMVIVGLAVFAVVISHRRNYIAMTISIVFGVFYGLIIKNSAVYFVIPALFSYIYCTLKYHRKIMKLLFSVLAIAISFSSLLLWSNHVSSTFVESSKHSVNADAYTEILSRKTELIRSQITSRYIEASINIFDPATFVIVVSMLVLIVVAYVRIKKNKETTFKTVSFVGMMLLYILIYYVGVYIMFMVSMPTEEALVLAGFERYTMSMGIFVTVITGFALMSWVDDLYYVSYQEVRSIDSFKSIRSKNVYQLSTLMLGLVVVMVYMGESNRISIQNNPSSSNLPLEFKNAMPDTLDTNDTYLVVSSNDDNRITSYYLKVVSEYYLWTKDIVITDAFYNYSQDEFIDILKSVDTVIVVSQNLSFESMIKDLSGFDIKNGNYTSDYLLKLIESNI